MYTATPPPKVDLSLLIIGWKPSRVRSWVLKELRKVADNVKMSKWSQWQWDCPPWVLEDPYFLDCHFCPLGFYPWGFCPMGILSIGLLFCLFVLRLFSVTPSDHINRMGIVHTCITYVIPWREGGLSTLSVRGSLFSGLAILSVEDFVLCDFCPLRLFSVTPRDHINRMGIAKECLTFSANVLWTEKVTWAFRKLSYLEALIPLQT